MEFDAITASLFLASAIRLSGPVLLAALGEVVSERAGVLNIGLEGMLLFAAFFAAAVTSWTGSPMLGISAGAFAGVVSAGVLGAAVVWMRADQIVAGIGFNIIALGATSLLRQLLLTGPSTGISMRDVSLYRIPYLWQLPVVGRGLFSQSPILYAAFIAGAAIWAVLKFTRTGLLLRAAGEGANAADAAGISVTAIRFGAILFTGLMAGFGGAYLAIVASGGVFVDNMTDGRGYLAIAIAIFGRWQPFWVMLAAVLFGFADSLQYQGQSMGLNIPPALLLMFPFVIALVAWVGLGRSKTSPANLGQPFLRGNR